MVWYDLWMAIVGVSVVELVLTCGRCRSAACVTLACPASGDETCICHLVVVRTRPVLPYAVHGLLAVCAGTAGGRVCCACGSHPSTCRKACHRVFSFAVALLVGTGLFALLHPLPCVQCLQHTRTPCSGNRCNTSAPCWWCDKSCVAQRLLVIGGAAAFAPSAMMCLHLALFLQ
jgi:hypothetical protein